MLPFELLALGYFIAFSLAALGLARGRGRAGRAVAASLVMAGIITVAAAWLPLAARDWLGHVYLVAGYWVPALAAGRGDDGAFERWLVNADARWQQRLSGVPRWLAYLGELAYLLCYPFIPAAFVCVWLAGTAADVDRFWVAVLLAGFSCYVSLPWLTARPPRLLASSDSAETSVARLNATVLARVSHGQTTFPSGHVAVAVAAALSLFPVSVPLTLLFAAVAAGIGLGAATGRYHYVVDVIAGAAVGLLALLAAAAVH